MTLPHLNLQAPATNFLRTLGGGGGRVARVPGCNFIFAFLYEI